MSNFTVATRYAESLMQMAEEKNLLEQISKDMESVRDTFKGSRELRNFLKNPVIDYGKKNSVLEEIFKANISDDTFKFIAFVLKKKREDILAEITERFLQLRDEKLRIVNASVVSAIELSDEQKESVKRELEKYSDKKVRLYYKLDKNIIGGFVIRLGDTVLDASLKRQLELLKEKFISGAVALN